MASNQQTTSFQNEVIYKICMSAAFHPVEYATFLIQIGHEPLPAYPTKTLFGQPIYILPNVLQYVKYIRRVDGLAGCYRGFIPKITGQLVGMFTSRYVFVHLKKTSRIDDEISHENRLAIFKQNLIIDIIGTSATVIASQPFVVISARMMAQFVGREETHNTITSSIAEIFKEQGILGFFSGVVPRWLGELAALAITSALIFGVNTFRIQDRELKVYTTICFQFITKPITYPMTVVASCMEVNNCGLAAGIPPEMPLYRSWTHCFNHLTKICKLYRGSSLFFRTCPSPHEAIKDQKLF